MLTGAKPGLQVQANGQVAAASLRPVSTVTDTNDLGREGQTTLVAPLNAGVNRIRLTTLDSNILSVASVRIAQPAQP